MNAWTVIALAGIGSLVLRISMVTAADRIRIPKRLEQLSALVAPAALAALATTGIASATTSVGIRAAAAPLIAAAVAVLAVWLTRSPHAAMLAGMAALWLMTALLPA
ncbi:MAG TPA: AzlD domain-containing protein [Micromonosporaceae bacterium]|jgi:branched-subunit amino acid transport protein|nr:AzlD domain-containing protein [Micromonosporaceae bacterium]